MDDHYDTPGGYHNVNHCGDQFFRDRRPGLELASQWYRELFFCKFPAVSGKPISVNYFCRPVASTEKVAEIVSIGSCSKQMLVPI